MAMNIDSEIKDDSPIIITRASLRKVLTDVLLIVAVMTAVGTPVWQVFIAGPNERRDKAIKELQENASKTNDRFISLDKNVAVILERTERQGEIFKRQEDSLNSIRRFLENQQNKR